MFLTISRLHSNFCVRRNLRDILIVLDERGVVIYREEIKRLKVFKRAVKMFMS